MHDHCSPQPKQQRARQWILMVFIYGGRSGGITWGNHARASSGGTSRRSGVRRGNGRYSGGFGGGGGGGAAAKTKQLGLHDQAPEKELEERTERKQDGLGYKVLGLPRLSAFTRIHGGRVGLVDSTSDKNKARAVVKIYPEPGIIRTPLAPFRYHQDENRTR